MIADDLPDGFDLDDPTEQKPDIEGLFQAAAASMNDEAGNGNRGTYLIKNDILILK